MRKLIVYFRNFAKVPKKQSYFWNWRAVGWKVLLGRILGKRDSFENPHGVIFRNFLNSHS
jgi:hypothetical protein